MKNLTEGLRGKVLLITLLLVAISILAAFTIFGQREELPVANIEDVKDNGLDIDVETEEEESPSPEDSPEEDYLAEPETTPIEETDNQESIEEIVEVVKPIEKEEKEKEKDPQGAPQEKENENKEEESQENENRQEDPQEKVEDKPIENNQAVMNQDLNSYVLDIIKTYQIGRYPYLLNNDYANYNGVTVNLQYKNQILLRAHPSGNRASHCSGITFEVFFKAMQERNKQVGLSPDDFNGMSYDELFDFVLTWYVANSNKATSNIAIAMEKYGVGRRITNFENAKAGDFLDFSRENNTGHTVVFLNWIRDNGKIVGLRYWGSQGSTNGINYKEEYFNIQKSDGTKYGNVMIDQVYIGRVGAINNYK